jgi:Meckel syndrome type 1 protein
MPVAEVIAKAKEAGHETSESNVSRVRAEAKKKGSKPAKKAPKKPAATKPAAKKAEKPTAKKPAPKKAETKAKKPAQAAPKPVAKPRAKKTGGPSQPASSLSKADFIRSQPATMGAKAVVEAAKAVGLTISENHVYGVRADLKRKAVSAPAKKPAALAKQPAKPPVAPKRTAATAPKMAPATSDEVTFRRLVLGIGVTRARQLLGELEAGLAALIGG